MTFCSRTLPALLLGALALANPVFAAKETLVFCFEDTDIRPWQTKNGSGLSFDLLNEVSIRTNIKFSYVARPWKRCLQEVKTNQVDGAIGVSWKADRIANGAYPGGAKPDANRAMHLERYVVIRKKGSTLNWDGLAFSNLNAPVGTQFGYSSVDDLKALDVTVDDGARGAHELLNKLKQDRIAAAVLLGGEARKLLAENEVFRTELEIFTKPLVEKPYYLLLSHVLVKEDAALSETLWNTLSKVRQSATYQNNQKTVVEKK